MKYKKIPRDVSVYVRYLHQHGGLKGKELTDKFPEYSPRSIHRHARLPIGEDPADKRKQNKGRPRLLTEHDTRHIERSIHHLRRTEQGVFTSIHIQEQSGTLNVSNRTVRRHLNRQGYGYRQCRKKGQLTDRDLARRLAYAKSIKKRNLGVDFWTSGIGFYVDGVSFVHKTNPCAYAKTARTRSWRKSTEGLTQHCTGKAKKEGTGGSVAKFMVSIAYGKGVIGVQQYEGSINGAKYADIIHTHFPQLLQDGANPTGGYFVQDNDPSQNSRKARDALKEVKAYQFSIPARSPDLNPIENMFHLASKKIVKDGKVLRIESETFAKFSRRCKRTLEQFPQDLIDKTIKSMDKRIQMVIDNKGQRTKY